MYLTTFQENCSKEGSPMRLKSTLVALWACIILSGITNICLFAQNKKLVKQNRGLILQNDSLLSVGIELNKKYNADSLKSKKIPQ